VPAREEVGAGGDAVEEEDAVEVVELVQERARLHELDHLDGILFLDRIASRADLFARRHYA